MQSRYVICVDNRGYEAALDLLKVYKVLDDPDAEITGMIRVIDESGEDYLYGVNRFVPMELTESALTALEKVTA